MSHWPPITRAAVATLMVLTLAACGAEDAAPAAQDTTPDVASTPDSDGASPLDVPTDTPAEPDSPATLGACEAGTFDRIGFAEGVWSVTPHIPGQLRLGAERGAGSERLELTLRHGGPFAGAWGPGSYDLSGQAYDDCDSCLSVATGCEGDDCEAVFFVEEGTLHITEWDEAGLVATLLSAVLVEVNIHNSIAIVPIPDGQRWCLDGLTFEVPLTVDDGPITQSDGCVTEGTGAYVGHNVADLTLPNCDGDPVSLHARCGQDAAVWIMATTGWCTACGIILNQMAEEHGGALTREGIRAQTPGLDMLVVLSEDLDGDAPTAAYCHQYAASHSLDPAMVLMDHEPAGIAVPLIDPLGDTWTFEAMAQTWSHLNPYLALYDTGVLQNVYPWNAVLDGRNMSYYWSDNLGEGSLFSAKQHLLPGE